MRFKFIFLLLVVASFAQAQIGDLPLQVIPPSPITREFDKYIKYNVSMNNGLPDINIPLYEIVVKGLTIPINLSYHASGIKHRQNSGEVGVGWVINPRYRVSKTVYGLEDGYRPEVILDPSSAFGTAKARDMYLTNFFYGSYYAGLPTASFSYDGEYDIYNYSMGSGSGTFIEKNVQTHEFELLDTRNVKITKQYSGNQYYFDLKDQNGVAYRMGTPNGPMETFGGGFSPVSGLAWMATQIRTPNNGIVNFEYITKNIVDQTPNLINSSLREGLGYLGSNDCFNTTETVTYPQYSTYSTSFIKTITTDLETIEFFHASIGELLQRIEIKDKNNVIKRRIEFTYRTHNEYSFLDAVSIFSSDGTSPQVYSLKYYAENGPLNLQTFDNWGYVYYANFAPYYNEYILPDMLKNSKIRSVTDCSSPTPPEVSVANFLSSYSFNDKNVSIDPVDYSLKRIIYPTGGFTEYEYESNKYLVGSSGAKKGAGLRIKNISSNDGLSGKTIIREYTYGLNESDYGLTRLDIGAEDFVKEGIWSAKAFYSSSDPSGVMAGGNAIAAKYEFSNKASNEVIADDAATVYYPEVNEYIKGVDGSIEGKTQFLYAMPELWTGAYDRFQTNTSLGTRNRNYYPRYIKRNIPWAKPYLTESNVFGYLNNSFNLLKKELIYSNEVVKNTFTGLKVRPFLIGGSRPYTDDEFGNGAYDNLVNSVFDYAQYYVISGAILPYKKRIIEYSALGNTEIAQYYYYNEVDQLVKEETTDSKSGFVVKGYKYPIDYKDLTGSDALTLGIKNLQTNNILGVPIESTLWNKTSGPMTLASAGFRSFNSSSIWPDLIQQIDNSTMLNDFSPSTVQNGTVVKDSRYRDKTLIKYDVDGSVLEHQIANGPRVSYVWSYNKQHPIAEIKNADYAAVVTALGGATVVNNFANSIPASKTVIDAFLAPIRNSLTTFKDAQIKTYSYEPLVGIRSVTDVKGMTTYYEYDGFQRLKAIKNDKGEIIKSYDYHYKP